MNIREKLFGKKAKRPEAQQKKVDLWRPAGGIGTEAAEPKEETPATKAKTPLDALIILTNRQISPSEEDSILSELKARGRSYRDWIRPETPICVFAHPGVKDGIKRPYFYGAMALRLFQEPLGDRFNIKKVGFNEFKGSSGLVGVVLAHWSERNE